MKPKVIHRSYKLKLYGNKVKTDTARYTYVRFNQYCNIFLGRIFFGEIRISTKGLGELANKAVYKSKAMVRALKAASKATGNKMNVPFAKRVGCYASAEDRTCMESHYDFKKKRHISCQCDYYYPKPKKGRKVS